MTMWGLLSDVKDFFALIVSLSNYLFLGAGIAFVGWLGGWVFKRSLAGLLIAMAVGAVIMAWSVIGAWLGDNSQRIRDLEAANYLLTVKQDELRLTGDALRKTLEEMRLTAEHNTEVMVELNYKLERLPPKTECDIDEDVLDELDKLQ